MTKTAASAAEEGRAADGALRGAGCRECGDRRGEDRGHLMPRVPQLRVGGLPRFSAISRPAATLSTKGRWPPGAPLGRRSRNARKGWEVWARVPYSLSYSPVQYDDTFYYSLMCELGQPQKAESKATYLTRRWDGKISTLPSVKCSAYRECPVKATFTIIGIVAVTTLTPRASLIVFT